MDALTQPLLLPPAGGASRSPGRGILPVGRAGPPGRRRVHLLPVLMPNPPDQRRRPKRLPNGDRPLAAGQVIVVGAIALGLAALLNAETLVSTFDRMPHRLGRPRASACAFAKPAASTSAGRCASTGRASASTRCGGATRAARGPSPTCPRRRPAAPAASVAPPTPPAATARPDGATRRDRPARGPRSRRPPGRRRTTTPPSSTSPATPTPAASARACSAWPARPAWSKSVLDYKVSSGLTRPDFFDWPKHVQKKVPEVGPQIVVVDLRRQRRRRPIKVDGKGYAVGDAAVVGRVRQAGRGDDGLPVRRRPDAHLGRASRTRSRDALTHRLTVPARRRAGGGGQAARGDAGRRLADVLRGERRLRRLRRTSTASSSWSGPTTAST